VARDEQRRRAAVRRRVREEAMTVGALAGQRDEDVAGLHEPGIDAPPRIGRSDAASSLPPVSGQLVGDEGGHCVSSGRDEWAKVTAESVA
jgi:hypothetical protein